MKMYQKFRESYNKIVKVEGNDEAFRELRTEQEFDFNYHAVTEPRESALGFAHESIPTSQYFFGEDPRAGWLSPGPGPEFPVPVDQNSSDAYCPSAKLPGFDWQQPFLAAADDIYGEGSAVGSPVGNAHLPPPFPQHHDLAPTPFPQHHDLFPKRNILPATFHHDTTTFPQTHDIATVPFSQPLDIGIFPQPHDLLSSDDMPALHLNGTINAIKNHTDVNKQVAYSLGNNTIPAPKTNKRRLEDEKSRKPSSVTSSKRSRKSGEAEDAEDDILDPEEKEEKEKERRWSNNQRERVRIRDINDALKELGKICSTHQKSDKPMTKLGILNNAVDVIIALEQEVRERNLDPKVVCLKRREEGGELSPSPNMSASATPNSSSHYLFSPDVVGLPQGLSQYPSINFPS